jgi:hypothetical protein
MSSESPGLTNHPLDPRIEHINHLQTNYKCCGLHSYLDWKSNLNLNDLKPYFVQDFLLSPNQIPFNVPDSCCVEPNVTNCGKDFALNSSIHPIGCFYRLKSELNLLGNALFVMSNILTSIMVLSIAIMITTAACIKSEYSFKEIFRLMDENENGSYYMSEEGSSFTGSYFTNESQFNSDSESQTTVNS